MEKKGNRRLFSTVLFLAILVLAVYIRQPGFLFKTKYRDIYFIWVEGERIASGVNPYERVRESDMVHNEKYPTYLPPIYLFTGLLVWLGMDSFPLFLFSWRILILGFDLAVGIFLFYYCRRREREAAGLFAAFFWFFSRWNLYVWEIGNTESIILFLMILSIFLWEKKPLAAGLLFGGALGLKHFGIVFLPVLLAHSKDTRDGLKRLCYVMIIPVASSLPFFLGSPEGFTKAMLFSVVRGASSHMMEDAKSIRILLGESGWGPRIFLFLAFVLYWIAAIREKWNLWLSAALAFALFLSFNLILFTQYFVWVLPFGCLFLADANPIEHSRKAGET